MKPTIKIEGKDDLSEYKAVSLLQNKVSLAIYPFPIPVDKESFRSKKASKGKEEPPFNFKDHILDIISVVHGSSLNKD